jgi:hypothetical protein
VRGVPTRTRCVMGCTVLVVVGVTVLQLTSLVRTDVSNNGTVAAREMRRRQTGYMHRY